MNVIDKLRLGILMLVLIGILSTCAAEKLSPTASSEPTIAISPTVTASMAPYLTSTPGATPTNTVLQEGCITARSWGSLSLSKTIEILGEPKAVELIRGSSTSPTETQCDCATIRSEYVVPEQDWPKIPDSDMLVETWEPYHLSLHYPQLGIIVSSTRLPEEYPCLYPRMQMEPALCSGHAFRLADLHKRDPIANENIYPWPGFGRADLDTMKPIEID
jgi:hypothetical protein